MRMRISVLPRCCYCRWRLHARGQTILFRLLRLLNNHTVAFSAALGPAAPLRERSNPAISAPFYAATVKAWSKSDMGRALESAYLPWPGANQASRPSRHNICTICKPCGS